MLENLKTIESLLKGDSMMSAIIRLFQAFNLAFLYILTEINTHIVQRIYWLSAHKNPSVIDDQIRKEVELGHVAGSFFFHPLLKILCVMVGCDP